MSMLEVHDLLLKTYTAASATLERPPLARQPSDTLAICYGTSRVPGPPPEDQKIHFADGRYTVPTRWLFINYMPRNNFYAKPYPQPKTQGCHWDWSEYWCWEDAQTPRRWPYRNFTARRSDLAWTINQVCFDAAIGERPGVADRANGDLHSLLRHISGQHGSEGVEGVPAQLRVEASARPQSP